jgi:hypothetical protein
VTVATTYPAPVPIQLLEATDYTGGLNLRANAYQLAPNESPDLLNVDLDPRGGFSMRQGVEAVNTTALAAVPDNIWSFANPTTNQIMVQVGNDVLYTGSGSFASGALASAVTGRMRACTFNDVCYIQKNGEQSVTRWTGSAATTLTSTFNDSISAPNDGDMPRAKLIAAHGGFVWVANTVESGTSYRNRIRWSHPNRAEDWRTNDYIDIDVGHDGDEITALLPMSDRLLIFKHNSVHAIFGYDPSSFQVVSLDQSSGAVSQEAVCLSEAGAYYFSWPNGLMHYDGDGVRWAFEKLSPAIADGSIPASSQDNITVAWINRRVWVALDGYGEDDGGVLVHDPSLGSTKDRYGGWTRYSLNLGPMLDHKPPGRESVWYACSLDSEYVYRLHQERATDLLERSGVDIPGGVGDYIEINAGGSDTVSSGYYVPVLSGDLDIRVHAALDDWSNGGNQTMMAKWETTAMNGRAFALYLDGTANLVLIWSTDGTATSFTKTSTTPVVAANGAAKWVRATLDVDNGAAGNDVRFYTSDDGVTWTQLGTTVTTAGVTTIKDTTPHANIEIGALDQGASFRANGVFYGAYFANAGVERFNELDLADPELYDDEALESAQQWYLVGNAAIVADGEHDIESFYTTRWHDAGNAAVVKRWKRPEVILRGTDRDIRIIVDVWHDYNARSVQRTLFLDLLASNQGMQWGDPWGTDWAGDALESEEIKRLSGLGKSRAVRLRFTGPTNPSVDWTVDAITFKYIPRRVRG